MTNVIFPFFLGASLVISILLLVLGYKLLEVLKELARELIKTLKDE